MDASATLRAIQTLVDSCVEGRQGQVDVEQLRMILSNPNQQELTEAEMAERSERWTRERLRLQLGQEGLRTHFASVVSAAQSALRSAILINGGAAVAVLAHLSKNGPDQQSAGSIAAALVPFLIGVLVSAMASGVTYIAQYDFGHRRERRGQVARWTAVALVGLAYTAFAVGCWKGVHALAG